MDEGEDLELLLFVAGMTPTARRALKNFERIAEDHLEGRYALEVVDLLAEPHRARESQILAVPTLVRERPLPVRRIIGDLSETDRVLHGLGWTSRPAEEQLGEEEEE